MKPSSSSNTFEEALMDKLEKKHAIQLGGQVKPSALEKWTTHELVDLKAWRSMLQAATIRITPGCSLMSCEGFTSHVGLR